MRRGGGDTAACGRGLAQVPAAHKGTRESGQDEYDHEPAMGLPSPEHPTGAHSQASPVSHVVQKQQGHQHTPRSLPSRGKPPLP